MTYIHTYVQFEFILFFNVCVCECACVCVCVYVYECVSVCVYVCDYAQCTVCTHYLPLVHATRTITTRITATTILTDEKKNKNSVIEFLREQLNCIYELFYMQCTSLCKKYSTSTLFMYISYLDEFS